MDVEYGKVGGCGGWWKKNKRYESRKGGKGERRREGEKEREKKRPCLLLSGPTADQLFLIVSGPQGHRKAGQKKKRKNKMPSAVIFLPLNICIQRHEKRTHSTQGSKGEGGKARRRLWPFSCTPLHTCTPQIHSNSVYFSFLAPLGPLILFP